MAGSKGGRGGKAGKSLPPKNKVVNITFQDGTSFRYMDANGRIYEISGAVPREVNTNIPLQQVAQNAKSMGATVEALTDADMAEIEKARAQKHKEWDAILSAAEVSLKRYFVSNSRARRSAP